MGACECDIIVQCVRTGLPYFFSNWSRTFWIEVFSAITCSAVMSWRERKEGRNKGRRGEEGGRGGTRGEGEETR